MMNLMQSQSALMSHNANTNNTNNKKKSNNNRNNKVTFASVVNAATAANASASHPSANANLRQKIAMRFSRVDQMHKDVTQQVFQTAQTALSNLPEAEQTRTVRDLK